MPLQLQPHFTEPGKRYFRDFSPGDDFYEALIDAHRDLTDEESERLNARLESSAKAGCRSRRLTPRTASDPVRLGLGVSAES